VIRGRDRWDTWHGGGGEAGMCYVVLPVVEGGTEILREGREASG
jgi:hypothetical protein